MNPGIVEHTRHKESFMENSGELSPPESKRMRLDDSCNHNLSSTLNSASKHSARWSYSGDTSLVKPEILADMGVSMLEDEAINCDSIKKTQDCAVSPSSSSSDKRLVLNENDIENGEPIYGEANFQTMNIDRLDQDPYDINNPGIYASVENESGYASRVETDTFGDIKDYYGKDRMNVSSKKNEEDFYLYRRKRKTSPVKEDKFSKLSDEMILMILKWLPKKCLVNSMLVCKRWGQIARDEALWSRLDLSNKVLNEGTLGYILPRGVQILRLAQAEIANPVFYESSEVNSDSYISKLQYLDLSMSVICPNGLAILLSKCKFLKKLSLEKCILNRACCKAISENQDLEVLNLAMCEGMESNCVEDLVKLQSLTILNMAWCSLDVECMTLLCKSLPPCITRLNISGCRKTITDNNIKDLVKSCPNIIELDLSDCTMLTMNTVPSLLNLSKLEHLSLSRCYNMPPSTYLRLAYMPCLLYLDVFGLMSERMLKSIQANCGETEINKFLYSSIARPTVGVRRTSIWGLRVRD